MGHRTMIFLLLSLLPGYVKMESAKRPEAQTTSCVFFPYKRGAKMVFSTSAPSFDGHNFVHIVCKDDIHGKPEHLLEYRKSGNSTLAKDVEFLGIVRNQLVLVDHNVTRASKADVCYMEHNLAFNESLRHPCQLIESVPELRPPVNFPTTASSNVPELCPPVNSSNVPELRPPVNFPTTASSNVSKVCPQVTCPTTASSNEPVILGFVVVMFFMLIIKLGIPDCTLRQIITHMRKRLGKQRDQSPPTEIKVVGQSEDGGRKNDFTETNDQGVIDQVKWKKPMPVASSQQASGQEQGDMLGDIHVDGETGAVAAAGLTAAEGQRATAPPPPSEALTSHAGQLHVERLLKTITHKFDEMEQKNAANNNSLQEQIKVLALSMRDGITSPPDTSIDIPQEPPRGAARNRSARDCQDTVHTIVSMGDGITSPQSASIDIPQSPQRGAVRNHSAKDCQPTVHTNTGYGHGTGGSGGHGGGSGGGGYGGGRSGDCGVGVGNGSGGGQEGPEEQQPLLEQRTQPQD